MPQAACGLHGAFWQMSKNEQWATMPAMHAATTTQLVVYVTAEPSVSGDSGSRGLLSCNSTACRCTAACHGAWQDTWRQQGMRAVLKLRMRLQQRRAQGMRRDMVGAGQ